MKLSSIATTTLALLTVSVAAGCAADRSNEHAATDEAELGVHGRLDTRFGIDGTVDVSFDDAAQPGVSNHVGALLADPDGKTLAAGIHGRASAPTQPVEDELVVARYTKDGVLDAAFAQDGLARVALPKTDAQGRPIAHRVHAMARQSDGGIIVLASAYTRQGGAWATLVRVHADGTADAAFGTSGVVQTILRDGAAASYRYYDRPRALAIDPNGRIIVAGDYVTGETFHSDPDEELATLAVVRLLPDGARDPSFTFEASPSSSGSFSPRTHEGNAVLALADGRILLACGGNIGRQAFVVRLAADGSLDRTFGNDPWGQPNGSSRLPMQSVGALTLDAQGRIHAAGSGAPGVSPSSAEAAKSGTVRIVRLDADGKDDTSFGTAGRLERDVPPTTNANGWANPVHVQGLELRADGKMLVAGARIDATARQTSFFAVRMTSDGSPDGTFGDRGVVLSAYGQVLDVNEWVRSGDGSYLRTVQQAWHAAYVLHADGKLVFAGNNARTWTNDPRDPVVWSSLLRRFR